MDSLTAESHAETLAKVTPLLEEGRHEEALPFFELHKSKSDDPIWDYLVSLSLACLARGEEGILFLESASQSPGFNANFGIPTELNTLVRTSALNHLMFETSVDSTDVGPWTILRRYAEILNHREYLAKAAVGRLKAEPESREAVTEFLQLFEDAPADKVIPVLDDIVNGAPQACQPRALLGSFLQQRGKTALAIRHLKTAADSDPNAMEPHLYLGKIYMAQARFDDAERELSEAMSKGSPTVALLVEVANCQKATYRYEEALQTMFSAFEIDPPSFRHWDLLVDIAKTSGQSELLAEKLREATDRFPKDARLRQRFAMMAFRQDDPLAAQTQLAATGIFENPTKDQALARLAAEVSASLEDKATAVKLLEALWKTSPNNPESCRVYGEALLADAQATEAEALLRETARNNPNDRGLQISWGRALLAMGDAERAHRAFSLASRLDPDDAEAMAEQGRAMLVLGLHDEALNVLKESAKKAEPPLAVTLVGLGAVYEKKELKDISRDFFRQALLRQPEREEAARGFVRTRPDDGSSTLAADALELALQLKSSFAQLRFWLNLLRGSLLECPGEARALSTTVYPEIVKSQNSAYSEHLARREIATLQSLSHSLESTGLPEKAREVWRFAVSSGRAEFSELGASELKRLDTYETQSAASTESDGLASLFSDAEGAVESDTTPTEEVQLFAEETPPTEQPVSSEPTSPPVTIEEDDVLAALFAVDVPEMTPVADPITDAMTDVSDALFASETSPEAQAEAAPKEEPLFVEDVVAMSAEEPEETEVIESLPVASSEALLVEDPLVTEAPYDSESQAEESDGSIELETVESQTEQPIEPDVEDLTVPEESVQLTPEEPSTGPIEQLEGVESTSELSEAPESTPPVESSETGPEPPNEPPSADFIHPTSNPPAEEKELLPIPMAADFSPLTRRQLHYHEALVAGGSGSVNPESLAHLLLQSAVGNEPPDPSSATGQSSTELLAKALIASSTELEQSQQFRGAARVLRTALLYQPESLEALSALSRVQLAWSQWLAARHEFAHAVALIREALNRQPDHAEAASQLETIYRQWIDWTSTSGDTAASDLLAVYLDQERSGLQELRQAFAQARSSRVTTPAPAVASPPPVPTAVATVTPPAATPTPPVVEKPQVAAPEPQSPPPATPAVIAPAAVSPPVTETVVEAAAPSPQPEYPPDVSPIPSPLNSESSGQMFETKEEAIETLDAAPEDESVAEAVFGLYADSMRELTALLKERSNSSPDQPAWLLLLARAFRRSGSETMAVIQYQKYIKVAPSPEAYEELAQTYEELGKEDFAKMTRRKAERA